MATSGSILGNPVLRKEDPGILTGVTEYYDDLKVAGLLHVAFVRSTIAHATIESIDADDAKTMPGVVAVYTAADLELPDVHGFVMLPPTMISLPFKLLLFVLVDGWGLITTSLIGTYGVG